MDAALPPGRAPRRDAVVCWLVDQGRWEPMPVDRLLPEHSLLPRPLADCECSCCTWRRQRGQRTGEHPGPKSWRRILAAAQRRP